MLYFPLPCEILYLTHLFDSACSIFGYGTLETVTVYSE